MKDAYKVTVNKHGVFIEPRAWLEDSTTCGVDGFYPTRKQNKNLAHFICEKMNRAFKTGRLTERDKADNCGDRTSLTTVSGGAGRAREQSKTKEIWGAFCGGQFVLTGTEHEMKNKVENENREPRSTISRWNARKLTVQEKLWYVR